MCLKHGFARSGQKRKPEYTIYHAMMSRCYRKTNISYSNYGGRGIRVCQRWKNGGWDGGGHRSGFECFLLDMGHRPTSQHSIDRVNNNCDYEPGNVRWATREQQNSNSRRNHWVVHAGQRMILSEALRATGMNSTTFYARLKRGWTQEAALQRR